MSKVKLKTPIRSLTQATTFKQTDDENVIHLKKSDLNIQACSVNAAEVALYLNFWIFSAPGERVQRPSGTPCHENTSESYM